MSLKRLMLLSFVAIAAITTASACSKKDKTKDDDATTTTANGEPDETKAAQSWKFDGTFGKPAAYIVQVQFKLVPPVVGDSALKSKSAPKPAVKKS